MDVATGSPDGGRPIGIFDSGLGGLTVLRAIRREMPDESLVFLGDTARVPYGTRSPSTVVRYALACSSQLLEYGVKLVVVACNTVSAVALPALRNVLPLPVLGVIEPGARSGVQASLTGRVGVIATKGTIASGAYERAIHAIDSTITVCGNAAPLLVPLVEEGWTEGDVPRMAVERYLAPLIEAEVDAIVLGCTHYPLLRPVVDEVLRTSCPQPVTVVDSAMATAADLKRLLTEQGLRCSGSSIPGSVRLLVTDMPAGFSALASRFLDRSVPNFDVEQIDITTPAAGLSLHA
ncbi:MAG: glutamate racemase [Polyangiaceae bacterium]|nr:glutamate racemase [Polyangiaceae bacterium]